MRLRLPRGTALTDLVWGLLGCLIVGWLVVDAGMWDDIPAFWKVVVLIAAVYEAFTLVNKDPEDTLSEGIWRYVPSRPIIGFILGILSLYLFPDIQPRDIWYFLASHFIFGPKPPTDAELFALAAKRRQALRLTLAATEEA